MIRLIRAFAERKGRTIFALSFTLGAVGVSSAARAATITVNTTGGPVNSMTVCNITDALQAASTNTRVHGCTAGSATATDTIMLAAQTYQGYGKALLAPATGGPLVIRGVNATSTIIMAPDYGYPSPSPLSGPDVCPYPAALYSGGTVTLMNLSLQSSVIGTTGICQYSGALTVTSSQVGDTGGSWWFQCGGIHSWPNTSNIHRTITLTNSTLGFNESPANGGGLSLYGNVDVSISGGTFYGNASDSAGGGIFWGGGWGKMGNLTITSADFFYNTVLSGWGGAINLDGDDVNATVTITADIQVNSVGQVPGDCCTGGAIFVGSGLGTNKVVLSNVFTANNFSYSDSQQNTLNSDSWVYNAVRCIAGSTIGYVTGSEWSGHSPTLKGDGTCTLQ